MRRGFTLVELLVALAILGFLVAAMVRIEWGLRASLEGLQKRGAQKVRLAKGAFLLHEDLLRATKLDITDHGRYTTLRLRTANSIFGIERPWVLWYVSDKNDTLMRVESAVQVDFPLADYERYYCYATKIAANCTSFAVKKSGDGKKLFVRIAFAQKEPIFFALPILHPQKKAPPPKAPQKQPAPPKAPPKTPPKKSDQNATATLSGALTP